MEEKRYIKEKTFWSLVTIMVIVVGYLFNQMSTLDGKFDGYKEADTKNYHELKTEVSLVKRDVQGLISKVDNILEEVKQFELVE